MCQAELEGLVTTVNNKIDVDGLSGSRVCALTGITYRQLDYWARTGLLSPSLAQAHGSGSKRRYSYRDVLEIKVIKKLLDSGVSLRSARRAVECLREDLGVELASTNLVLNESRSVLVHSGGEVVDLLAHGQGVFNIVPLAGVVSELDADIVRFESESETTGSGSSQENHEVANSGGGTRSAVGA